MGNANSVQRANFEDVQLAIKTPGHYFLLNTLPFQKQECLIPGTIFAHEEEQIVNALINKGRFTQPIIIYGENANDSEVFTKYNKLRKFGFENVMIYGGGLFEWLLLQDIYGFTEFPTTQKKVDLLRYKPKKQLGVPLLEYY